MLFRFVAGEQDHDCVQVRAGQFSDPVIWVILPGVAEHLGPGDHSLLELFGKRGQRSLIYTQRPQPVPGEGHGHPAILLLDGSPHRRSRLHFFGMAASHLRPPAA